MENSPASQVSGDKKNDQTRSGFSTTTVNYIQPPSSQQQQQNVLRDRVSLSIGGVQQPRQEAKERAEKEMMPTTAGNNNNNDNNNAQMYQDNHPMDSTVKSVAKGKDDGKVAKSSNPRHYRNVSQDKFPTNMNANSGMAHSEHGRTDDSKQYHESSQNTRRKYQVKDQNQQNPNNWYDAYSIHQNQGFPPNSQMFTMNQDAPNMSRMMYAMQSTQPPLSYSMLLQGMSSHVTQNPNYPQAFWYMNNAYPLSSMGAMAAPPQMIYSNYQNPSMQWMTHPEQSRFYDPSTQSYDTSYAYQPDSHSQFTNHSYYVNKSNQDISQNSISADSTGIHYMGSQIEQPSQRIEHLNSYSQSEQQQYSSSQQSGLTQQVHSQNQPSQSDQPKQHSTSHQSKAFSSFNQENHSKHSKYMPRSLENQHQQQQLGFHLQKLQEQQKQHNHHQQQQDLHHAEDDQQMYQYHYRQPGHYQHGQDASFNSRNQQNYKHSSQIGHFHANVNDSFYPPKGLYHNANKTNEASHGNSKINRNAYGSNSDNRGITKENKTQPSDLEYHQRIEKTAITCFNLSDTNAFQEATDLITEWSETLSLQSDLYSNISNLTLAESVSELKHALMNSIALEKLVEYVMNTENIVIMGRSVSETEETKNWTNCIRICQSCSPNKKQFIDDFFHCVIDRTRYDEHLSGTRKEYSESFAKVLTFLIRNYRNQECPQFTEEEASQFSLLEFSVAQHTTELHSYLQTFVLTSEMEKEFTALHTHLSEIYTGIPQFYTWLKQFIGDEIQNATEMTCGKIVKTWNAMIESSISLMNDIHDSLNEKFCSFEDDARSLQKSVSDLEVHPTPTEEEIGDIIQTFIAASQKAHHLSEIHISLFDLAIVIADTSQKIIQQHLLFSRYLEKLPNKFKSELRGLESVHEKIDQIVELCDEVVSIDLDESCLEKLLTNLGSTVSSNIMRSSVGAAKKPRQRLRFDVVNNSSLPEKSGVPQWSRPRHARMKSSPDELLNLQPRLVAAGNNPDDDDTGDDEANVESKGSTTVDDEAERLGIQEENIMENAKAPYPDRVDKFKKEVFQKKNGGDATTSTSLVAGTPNQSPSKKATLNRLIDEVNQHQRSRSVEEYQNSSL